ncbi:MAG: CoA transferase [Clostridiales Family XIII bacterium]|jgi:crotonobetainyl-CoA:carnitine CoA-transferase CaiB-like acyl-CoA transferase|nr:CoA transferase [Clostridiales Family XIII bacterium]
MLPLKGIRVLDLTILSGYCGMELADYGAEVIKIEPPFSGDPLRALKPVRNGANPHHIFRDRGKKSITLDLRQPEGKDIFRKLVATADAIIENFPRGKMDSLGLGYEALSAINPALVYGRISGCGSEGAGATFPQAELLAQARSGVMHVTGFPQNPPTRIGFNITERYTAGFLSAGICIAIYHARTTGTGQMVETSLCGSGVAISEDKVISYSATGIDPMRTGNAHPQINPYDILSCKDGYVALSLGSDDQWLKFCDAFKKPEWKEEDKFSSNMKRGENYFSDLRIRLEDLFSAYTMQEIADICDSVLIPGTMCGTTEQALREPQLRERNMLVCMQVDGVGAVQMPGRPVKFVGETEEDLLPAPGLGQHNTEIYGALFLDDAALTSLQAKGVI